jgi:hypothetical protein
MTRFQCPARLESAGWVRRRPHPGDRRYVLIELTPRAAAGAPEGLAAYHAAIRELSRAIPAAEREIIVGYLTAAAAAATAAADQLTRSVCAPASKTCGVSRSWRPRDTSPEGHSAANAGAE